MKNGTKFLRNEIRLMWCNKDSDIMCSLVSNSAFLTKLNLEKLLPNSSAINNKRAASVQDNLVRQIL